VTAYDAAYLALAEVLDCPLLTCDQALAGVPGHTAEVQVIA
jgi:predicted nucleic acid-binding protein